jgi:hypothetical protein
MKGIILLNRNENTKAVEEEEKYKFLRLLIEQIGIPINEFWVNDDLLTVDQRIKLREVLLKYSIQVIDDLDGHMTVFFEGELIGEWNKCTYKLKRDLSQIDPRKQLYLEMEINYWSPFEQEST